MNFYLRGFLPDERVQVCVAGTEALKNIRNLRLFRRSFGNFIVTLLNHLLGSGENITYSTLKYFERPNLGSIGSKASVVDPDPVGSWTFKRIRTRIRKNTSGPG